MHTDKEAEILRVDDVTVDVGARKVRRGETDLPMGRLSFEFLLALARAAPDAMAADDLIATVWGQAAITDETLQQRVRLVRQALGDLGSERRYIETVRGHGYRLIPAVSREGRTAMDSRAPVEHAGIGSGFFGWLVKVLLVLVLLMVLAWISVLMRGAKRNADEPRGTAKLGRHIRIGASCGLDPGDSAGDCLAPDHQMAKNTMA